MFTGIVQGTGQIAAAEARGGDMRMTIISDALDWQQVNLGDSIAVNGVCLTVIENTGKGFIADLSNETLSLTTAGSWQTGQQVNLEPALRVGDALGGHLMSGHVDGVGRLESLSEDARSIRMSYRVPAELAHYIARKGSIAIDGVSLTVNSVAQNRFDVNIVPHTAQVTTLGNLKEGDTVNIEVDVLARYMERLLQGGKAGDDSQAILMAVDDNSSATRA